MRYEFTIPVAPVAWERVKRGKHGQAYVPPKTASFKRAVSLYGHNAAKSGPLVGPLKMTVKFVIPRPLTVKRESPWVRPDLDNYIKALKDGLIGSVYEDDAQVILYGEGTGKYYDQSGGKGRIEVLIEELGHN